MCVYIYIYIYINTENGSLFSPWLTNDERQSTIAVSANVPISASTPDSGRGGLLPNLCHCFYDAEISVGRTSGLWLVSWLWREPWSTATTSVSHRNVR